ncbi:hypothetical protein [Longimicrobium sp.]|uniref:hypothetical protein n=1 Tax=Longimicrobium sp. TaxID=2029185 RepID=UPI003B3A7B5C
MQGLLRGTFFCLALALGHPAFAQPAGAPLTDPMVPDTAQLRRGLAAALGGDLPIVHTELHRDLYERGGIFWTAHVRPLRSGDYSLRYVYEYIDRVKPHDPLYTHVEHTTGFSVGEAGCARRAEGRTACLGDVIVIPIVAGDDRGPLGGHVFEASRRGNAGAWQRFQEATPEDDAAAATPNPAAPHLRYLGARLDASPHRSLGETAHVTAVFEAGAPGALELSVSGVAVPVVIVARGTPVTVLLEHERIRQYNERAPFASHLGSSYSHDVLLLQPGDRMDVQFLTRTVHGHDFTDEEKEAFRRTPPEITVRPFRVDRDRRFNPFIVEHLPARR